MKMIIFFLLVSMVGHAEERSARYFQIGKTEGALLFVQKSQTQNLENGDVKETANVVDADGKLVMKQSSTCSGSRLKLQNTSQLQTREAYEVEVVENRIKFRTYALEPNDNRIFKSENTVVHAGPFLTGPVFENFVRENWEKLRAGETLKAQFGVLEAADIFTFEFKVKKQDAEMITLQMRPANFLLRMAISPIEMRFRSSDKRIIYYKGRTPLKTMVGGRLKSLDAEIIYD